VIEIQPKEDDGLVGVSVWFFIAKRRVANSLAWLADINEILITTGRSARN